MTQTIPVLALSDFTGEDVDRQGAFVQALGNALETIGFFSLANHGIDAGLIQAAYSASAAVFSLPEAIKASYEDFSLQGQRGFTAFGREHAKKSSQADLKEFWHIGPEGLSPANLWPQEVPAFRSVMIPLFQQLQHCADILLAACALYLQLPRPFFQSMTLQGPTLLRVAHYPPIPADVHPASLRAAPHEDINLITLLCEATRPGLELRQADGTWLPIAPIPGQIIVDVGDMLQNLTNGVFKSTTHRVTNPQDDRDRRFSLPFFVHPRPETDLSPLDGCLATSKAGQRFPNITAGDYLAQRLQEIGLS